MKSILKREFWTLEQLGPRLFSATATPANKLCFPEHRTYASKDTLEHDFGKVDFGKVTFRQCSRRIKYVEYFGQS